MAELADADPVGDLAGDFENPTREQWLGLVEKVLKGRPLDTLHSRTADGIDVQPLYTDGPDEASTGAPGAAPYTRSFSASQRPGGSWDIRVVVEGSTGSERTPGALEELEGGATSLLVGGAALASPEALGVALRGVQLEAVPVVLEPGSGFTTTARWLMDLWAERGVADGSAVGGLGVDPLGLLAGTGHLPQGIERALVDGTGLAAMACERLPAVRTWSVDATRYGEAGASEAVEIAAMLATAVTYLRSMADAGLDAEAAAERIEVTLGADADFFTTIAKLRAARRTYAAVAQACGVDVATSPPAFTVRTLRRNLSRRDPWVNLLRVTSAAFAAALGGADTIISSPFDSVLGEPSELGRRMARNTQLLLAQESNVGTVVDPAGGSWYVESLTDAMATEAWAIFSEIESAGGMSAVLLDGSLAGRITSVREAHFAAVATREAPITGISEYPDLREELPSVAAHRPGRPPAAEETDAATRCGHLEPVRWAEPFERLRDAADAVRTADGDTPGPRVFLANMGAVATHTARATWARNLFEAGGIEGVTSERGAVSGFSSADEAAGDFVADGASVVCICSSDEVYAELAADTAEALVAAGAERVYLAGRPGESEDRLRGAGVDVFVHAGTDVLEVLADLHTLLGISSTGDDPGRSS